ncbi:MATE family efflux transporter [Streptomyces sp. NPDC006514]|uniref:MATE family efflux transporter n=1 Tax=Streptomyces sp. NPDC006514 TaxID=3154308 RepID=UPI0033B8BAFB
MAWLAVVPSAVALTFGRPLISLVTDDPQVIDRAWAATPLALLSPAPLAVGMSHAALLRAAGDTRAVMFATVTSGYLLLILLGWLFGVHAGLGLPGIYLAWIGFGLLYVALLRRRYRQRFASAAGPSPGVSASGGRT